MTETGSGVVYDGVPLDGVEVKIDDSGGDPRAQSRRCLRAYRDGTDPASPTAGFTPATSGRGTTTGGSSCTVAAAT